MIQQIPAMTIQVNDVHVISSWLNHAERNFIKVLNEVVENRVFIFTKVRVNDVLLNIDNIQDCYLDKYENKTFDFLLCSISDLSVKCVVELDDRPCRLQVNPPEQSYRQLCDDLNIPLLEIPAKCGYDHKLLASQIGRYV